MSINRGLGENFKIITVPSNDITNANQGALTEHADFQVNMPYQVNFPGTWMCSLLEINYLPAVINTVYYVYSDLITPQIVGSANVQLLRTVPGVGALQDTISRQPEPQEWRQIQQNSVGSLAFTIRDGNGNIPTFTSPTIITIICKKVD